MTTRKQSQKQCSSTKTLFRKITVISKGKTRIYKAIIAGSSISLKIRIPASKIAKRIKNDFISLFEKRGS